MGFNVELIGGLWLSGLFKIGKIFFLPECAHMLIVLLQKWHVHWQGFT
jgi:hypothetical protein